MPTRLDTEDTFAIETEDAEDFFPKDPPVSPNVLRDYWTRTGTPMVRADTLRRYHSDYTEAQPLRGIEDDLLDRLTHPHVMEARRAADEIREDLANAPASDMERQASLKSALNEALDEVEDRADEIAAIENRIDNGDTLDAKQMSLLIDRKVEPETQRLTSMDGREFTAETSYSMGTMNGSRFGSSSQWSLEAARRMYRDLPRRLLRSRSRKVEDKPQERSTAQHIEQLGVETVVEALDYFDREPAQLFVSNGSSNSKSKPRKCETPPSVLR
ncbi:hypothetical protein GGQ13_000318 [Salinibacter ruber]|jgi:hypothetical protein|uniref:hypothetical protein n=1 Tax=Salinibacter ruber TaxID=146919 RepID=UPI002166D8F8|nr:hypothetical protein [Salinibacter ruber]MCS4136914.1 hypothetical protein [Salinibacter ruber]